MVLNWILGISTVFANPTTKVDANQKTARTDLEACFLWLDWKEADSLVQPIIMSFDLNAMRPGVDDAVSVSSKKRRYVYPTNEYAHRKDRSSSKNTLVARCRSVVVANLERYPPVIFQMLAEADWEDIIRCKHHKTAPQKGSGGLDGTGRRAPALSEKFIAEVEQENPHLAESQLSDELIWRDCVEFRFKQNGLTRPRGLLYPWPLLVKQAKDISDVFLDFRRKEDEADKNENQLMISGSEESTLLEAAQTLREMPMNVALLKESGVGIRIQKVVKKAKERKHKSVFKRVKIPARSNAANPTRISTNSSDNSGKDNEISVLKLLDKLLQTWKDLAASKGIDVEASGDREALEQLKKDDTDLKRAEKCKSWRQLFATLKERAEQNRVNLGQKMRENRKKENSQRPQIVKVRPANPRREAILDRVGSASASNGGRDDGSSGSKMVQLRKEASLQSAREKSRPTSFKAKSGFGAAVAFAASTKLTAKQKQLQQSKKRKANPVVALGGGKRMAVPQGPMRTQNSGAPSLIAKKSAAKATSSLRTKFRR